MKKIAVVSGGNRGIGLEICRQLAQAGLEVILTSRTSAKGKAARDNLAKTGLEVNYAQLDVNSEDSIKAFATQMKNEYGRVDVLVNNAGIMSEGKSVFDTSVDDIHQLMETNVYGPLLLCQQIIPLMKENNYGRIVNLSSGMGQLNDMGGGYTGYRLSKVSLNALTRIMANELKNYNILVNTMCPGWVKTDMGGTSAPREVAEGADTATWLATLPDDGPNGKFFRDRKEIPW